MGRYDFFVWATVCLRSLQSIPRGIGPDLGYASHDEYEGMDFNHLELCAAGRIYL
jgi:hypothetical protein